MLSFGTSNDGHRLLVRAGSEAGSLGLSHAGPDHYLLALLHPDEETPASRVLNAVGADYAQARTTVAARTPSPTTRDDEGADWVRLNPAAHQAAGRAEGLAAALGATTASAEHLLLALLWSRDRWLVRLFQEIGMGRDEVLREMRRQRVKTPDGQLPATREPPDDDPLRNTLALRGAYPWRFEYLALLGRRGSWRV